MDRNELNRRDFHKLTTAAFGGLMAGAAVGCSKTETENVQGPPKPAATEVAMADVHVCRGLNTCKGKGIDGKNACAGQGVCATKAHSCGAQNDCKGQGGCGETPGENACKGKGDCAVPLGMGKSWEKARARFEERMKKAGKEFGAAPPKP